MFQQANLLPSLTALDQLLLAAHDAASRCAGPGGRAERVLARSGWRTGGTGGRTSSPAASASGSGSPARCWTATGAPAGRTHPALDHERGADVVELIGAVTAEHGVASLLVTHDQAHARRADRSVTLHDGGLR